MNIKEKQMLEILSELHASHSVFSVKAEFEAEGTRNDDLLSCLLYTSDAADE